MSIFKQKARVFFIHLSISALVIGLFVLHIVFIAYTPPLLEIEGGGRVTGILVAVGLILGPIMTAILYRQGKKGLRGDLIMVVVLQMSAFFYGAYTLYSQRPLYLVYLDADFWMVSSASVDLSRLKNPDLKPSLFGGPKLVYVEYLTGEGAMESAMKILEEGKGLQQYPEYYQSMGDNREKVLSALDKREYLKNSGPEWSALLDKKLASKGISKEKVVLSRIMGTKGFVSIILDRNSLEMVGIIGPAAESGVH